MQDLETLKLGGVGLSPSRWALPPAGFVCLDVDASFYEENNRCRIGGVIRDFKGQPLAAFGQSILMSSFVVLRELFAILAGIEIIRERDINRVVVSSDSLLTVQAVTESNGDLSYVGLCASEINSLISVIDGASICHIKRSAN
ncbi:uncharacterized protein [Henckelia pumila]|uniref:uncharacterized protein n=1 Tax=Henckelia pumila TaxID=405737 RepID=UPI003C6E9EF4